MSSCPTALFPLGLFWFFLPAFPSVHQRTTGYGHWAVISLVVANHPLATCDQVLCAVQLAVPWWQELVGPHRGNCLWLLVLGKMCPSVHRKELKLLGIWQRPELWAWFSTCFGCPPASQVLGNPLKPFFILFASLELHCCVWRS